MAVRGIRGAISVDENSKAAILASAAELLRGVVEANGLRLDDICSAQFSMTDDLDAVFPAVAARDMGWDDVPLFCCREIAVPGSLPRCLRVLVHVNTGEPQSAMKHVYLKEAVALRPDLAARS